MAHKILVVDDEVALCDMIEVVLTGEGYEVFAAYDGIEALNAVEEIRPDLILLDVMMPQLDGFATLKRLKANPETENIPVIMLTAKDDNESMTMGWEAGADLYMTKPFSRLELTSFIRRLLSARSEDEFVTALRAGS